MPGDILGVMEVAARGGSAGCWGPPRCALVPPGRAGPAPPLWPPGRDPLGSGAPAVPPHGPGPTPGILGPVGGSSMTSMGSRRERAGPRLAPITGIPADPPRAAGIRCPGRFSRSVRGRQAPQQHPGRIHCNPERDPAPGGGSGRPSRSRADPEQILSRSRAIRRREQGPVGADPPRSGVGSAAQSGGSQRPAQLRGRPRGPAAEQIPGVRRWRGGSGRAGPGRAGRGAQGHPASRRPVPTFSCSFSISSLCASSDSSSTRRCAVSFFRNSISLWGPAGVAARPRSQGTSRGTPGFGCQGRTPLGGALPEDGPCPGRSWCPTEPGNGLGWNELKAPSVSQGAPGPLRPGLDDEDHGDGPCPGEGPRQWTEGAQKDLVPQG